MGRYATANPTWNSWLICNKQKINLKINNQTCGRRISTLPRALLSSALTVPIRQTILLVRVLIETPWSVLVTRSLLRSSNYSIIDLFALNSKITLWRIWGTKYSNEADGDDVSYSDPELDCVNKEWLYSIVTELDLLSSNASGSQTIGISGIRIGKMLLYECYWSNAIDFHLTSLDGRVLSCIGL